MEPGLAAGYRTRGTSKLCAKNNNFILNMDLEKFGAHILGQL
jgi:hypothetical protein